MANIIDTIIDLLSGAGSGVSTTITAFKVASFEFDCALEESHESTLTVTDNPMESGAVATDHSYVNPKSFAVRGRMLSYDPVNGGGSETRVTDAFQALEAIKDARQPVSVTTNVKEYENMLITGVVVNKNEEDGAEFTVTVREIIISSTQTVTGLVVATPKTKEAPKTTPAGDKKTGKSDNQSKKPDAKGKTQPKAEPPKSKKSAAKTIGDIIRGS